MIILVLAVACNKSDNTTISGNYIKGAGEYLVLEMLQSSDILEIDSLKIRRNGNFKFNFQLDHPELFLIRNQNGKHINILAFPGDNIEVNIAPAGFKQGYTIEGSDESKKIQTLVDKVGHTKSRLDSVNKALSELDDPDSEKGRALANTYMEIFRDQKMHNIRFIVENLNSLSSIYALYQRVAPDIYVLNDIMDLQYFKIVADSAQAKYPGSSLTRSLVNDVKVRLSEYNSMMTLNKLSGKNISETGMIDLEIENTEGDLVSLSSLNGNVVLLSFWSSWDEQSRKANRLLKNIYNKYHDKGFEVYAVAMDQDRSEWKKAISFEEYPWINVCELTYPYSYAATVYNVTSIPVNYLIDREGNIVAKNITGSILATWLDNLL
ncbi:MAG: AhpC/TSA family protein [Bacteroidales bacterium]|nr:AhpC/TSA family protein [Bacteroidales bacterium]